MADSLLTDFRVFSLHVGYLIAYSDSGARVLSGPVHVQTSALSAPREAARFVYMYMQTISYI